MKIFSVCNSIYVNEDTFSNQSIYLPCNIVIRESNLNTIYVGILSPKSVQAFVIDTRIIEMIDKIKLIIEKEFHHL